MSSIKLSAQKVKDVSNLQKIAEAWRECAINRGFDMTVPGNAVTHFVQLFAGIDRISTSDIVLNDANVYISPGDKYASKLRDEMLTHFDGNKITWTDSYINTSNFMNSSSINAQRISYCLVVNLPPVFRSIRHPLDLHVVYEWMGNGMRRRGYMDLKAVMWFTVTAMWCGSMVVDRRSFLNGINQVILPIFAKQSLIRLLLLAVTPEGQKQTIQATANSSFFIIKALAGVEIFDVPFAPSLYLLALEEFGQLSSFRWNIFRKIGFSKKINNKA
jgi:hypothetical protein